VKFSVSKISDIICEGCGGTTRVAPSKVYNTDDLACNCPAEGELFGKADLDVLLDKPIDNEPKPYHNSKVAKAQARENKAQEKMFEEEPENVFEEETMSREQVELYLKTLKWQELLNSASNNGVKKQPQIKRDELELMILDAVFGDADTVVVTGENNE